MPEDTDETTLNETVRFGFCLLAASQSMGEIVDMEEWIDNTLARAKALHKTLLQGKKKR